MEEHLRQFEALFNYATIGIILCNDRAEIINFNAEAEEQFGYKKEELIGKRIEVLLPQRYREGHASGMGEFYKHPESKKLGHGRDLFGLKKDGKEFPVEISLGHYRYKGDMYVVAFVIDITVRKNNELAALKHREELHQITKQVTQLNIDLEQKVENRTKMLRETLAELEKSKKEVTEALEKEKELGDLKTDFVTMASHEFRTPLSTILSSAFLLSKYNGPDDAPKQEKHITRIKEAVTGMKSILEDFLSLGHLEEGSVRANIQAYEADEYREELQNTIESMMQNRKTGQTIRFIHTGNGTVYADLSLLKNIVINLVFNAIKFSPENTAIQVHSCIEEHDLILKVKDEGIGIAREDQQHLFEKFFRAGNAVNIQGTGLGLHIIGKYLELMKGHIELKSDLNSGTEFTIKIPQPRS